MRRLLVGVVVCGISLGTACAPPPVASPDVTGFVQVCAAQYPISAAYVTIVAAQPGDDLQSTSAAYYAVGMNGLPEWVPSTSYLTDVMVGQSYPLFGAAVLDPGRCVNVWADAGVTYRISVNKNYDPSAYLVWVNNLDGGPLIGWMPCGDLNDGAAPDGCTVIT